MKAVDLLRIELRQARLAFEEADRVWQNPYSTHDAWRARCEAWGRWNGIARAMEVLLEKA